MATKKVLYHPVLVVRSFAEKREKNFESLKQKKDEMGKVQLQARYDIWMNDIWMGDTLLSTFFLRIFIAQQIQLLVIYTFDENNLILKSKLIVRSKLP